MTWLNTIGGFLFGRNAGEGKTAVAEIAEVFTVNAENQAQREANYNHAALAQYQAEFHNRNNRTRFDSFVDGLNRLVRPLMALTCFGSLVATVAAPDHMKEVYLALAVVPAGMWALNSLVFSFFFGGRMQIKAQDFRQAEAVSTAIASAVATQVAAPTGRDYSALAGEMD